MPMNRGMNDREVGSGDASAEPGTIIFSAPRARDRTRVAALTEETRRLDVVEQADLLAIDHAVLAERYEVGVVLGRGTTGVVHRGYDRVLCRDVAIKLLYSDLAGKEEMSVRFQQEAQLAARIHHPNAVAIFDTGVHDGQQFIVMECLPGDTLAARIATQPLSMDQVRGMGAQLLGALDAAHQCGVIHRDIKPANLLMTSTGAVKVADFGIATEVDRLSLTSVGFVVGTLAYLAPERLRGSPATMRSDIYSAGVVLYEMLTARKPFEGGTAAAMLEQISNRPPIDITALRPDIDPALARVVMRALEKEPEARYATAAAMAEALEKSDTSKPEPVISPPFFPTEIIPVTDAGGPHRPRRSRAAAVVAAIVATLIAAAFASRDDGFPAPLEPESITTTVPANPSTTVVTTTLPPATTQSPATTARGSDDNDKDEEKGRGKKDD